MTIQSRCHPAPPLPVAGAAPPALLLIHGLGGTPAEMHSIARAASAAGYPVVTVQLAGHCGSEADLAASTWQDWLASVESAHATAVARHGAVLTAGLCLGAMLALALALRHPQTVRGLALYSLPLWYDGWAVPPLSRLLLPLLLTTRWGRAYRFAARDPFGIKDPHRRAILAAAKHRGDSLAAGTAAITGGALIEMQALRNHLLPRLPTISTPALIVHSHEDDIAGPRSPQALARALGGPNRILWLRDCYHMITLDRHRDRVARETLAFFAETAGGMA